jgi:hypothetical protein
VVGAAALTVAAPGALATSGKLRATNQGYPHNVIPKVSPAIKSTGGLQGAQTSISRAKTSGGLPFTGAQLWLFALVGIGLVGGGVLLKSTARSRSKP